jgi:hypothetical protein
VGFVDLFRLSSLAGPEKDEKEEQEQEKTRERGPSSQFSPHRSIFWM